MMCVEVPVKTLRDEIEKMRQTDGFHSGVYAKGVIDALEWLLEGKPAPSTGEGSFPLLWKKAA